MRRQALEPGGGLMNSKGRPLREIDDMAVFG